MEPKTTWKKLGAALAIVAAIGLIALAQGPLASELRPAQEDTMEDDRMEDEGMVKEDPSLGALGAVAAVGAAALALSRRR